MSSDSFEVRVFTNYYISINLAIPIGSENYIRIVFPPEYTNLPSGTVNCSSSNIESSSSSPCSFSSNNLTYDDCVGESTTSIAEIKVNHISNPLYATTTSSFEIYLYDSQDNLVQGIASGVNVTITPLYMQAASISPGSQLVGVSNNWTVSFTLSYDLSSGGYVELDTPVWNNNLGSSTTDYYCNGVITCTGINSNSYTDLVSSLSCNCTNGVILISLNQNLSASSASFTISPIKNPPSTKPVSGFLLSTKYSGYYIEQSKLSLSVSVQASLNISSVRIKPSTVSTLTDYTFDITCGAPVSSLYWMIISFPGDFNVSSAKLSGVIGINGGGVTVTASSSTIYMTQGIHGYLEAGYSIEFDVSNIYNPYSTQPSGPITISITTNDNNLVCGTSKGYSITATAGNISSISIVPADSTIYSTTTYAFTFNLDLLVTSTSYIQIVFPSEIIVLDRLAANCTRIRSGFSSNSLCAVASSNLTISNCLDSNYSGMVSFEIDGITNPTSCAATSPFGIYAYSSSGYLILYNAFTSIKATPGVLKSGHVTSNSSTTGDVAAYTFNLTITHTIPPGGALYIVLPAQVSFASPTCSDPVGFSSSYVCTFDAISVTVSNGITAPMTAGSLGITILGLKNPGTTQEPDSFKFYTNSSGYPIDYLDNGLKASMSIPHLFNNVTVTTSNDIVGNIADFSFYIYPYNPMYSSGVVQIIPPVQVSFNTNPVCSPLTGIVSVSCLVVSGVLNATVALSSSLSSSAFGFVVKSCINPNSTMTTNSFQVYSYYNSYKIDQITENVTLKVSTPGSLSASILLQDYSINKTTNYTLQITTANSIPAGGYFLVGFPSNVTIPSNVTCTKVFSCTKLSSFTIQVYYSQSILPVSNISMIIESIQNPSHTGTVTFSITSKAGDYSIDSLLSIPVTYTCQSPCATCNLTASACLSCVASSPYLYLSQCYSKCPSGTTSNTTKMCVPCSLPCTECSTTVSTCTSCNSTTLLYGSACVPSCLPGTYKDTNGCLDCGSDCYNCTDSSHCNLCDPGYSLYSNKCTQNCPSGTLPLSGLCTSCTSPCSTCSSSLDACSSCISGYSLYNRSCIKVCPDGTASVQNICTACDDNCNTCKGNVSTCTSCGGYLYLYSGTCTSACPLSTVLINRTCIDCDPLCSRCGGTSDYCLECTSGAYFYHYSCRASCPSRTTSVGRVCEDCLAPCSGCKGAADSCTSCLPNYYLYNSQCVAQCPSMTTISYTNSCKDCNSSCFTCAGAENVCTSCISNYYLLNKTCVSACPSGYINETNTCIEIMCSPGCTQELYNNSICDSVCNLQVCSWDNGLCLSESSAMPIRTAPLPFTVSGVGAGCVNIASKVFVPTTYLTSATVAVWGIVETTSWIAVLSEVSKTETSNGRRLLSSESDLEIIFILLLLCVLGHFIINIVFSVIYYCTVLKKDSVHNYWVSNKHIVKWAIIPLTVLISFKFIRMLDAHLFGFSCFKADFDKKNNLYRPLIVFSYISIVFTTLPTLGCLIYILVVYSRSTLVFVYAIDSLIITVLMLILTTFDIFVLSLALSEVPKVSTNSVCINVMSTNQPLGPQRFNIFTKKGDETDRSETIFDTDFSNKIYPEPEDENNYKETISDQSLKEKPDDIYFRNSTEFNIIEENQPQQTIDLHNTRSDIWNISFESLPVASYKPPPPRILEVISEESDLDLSNAEIDEDRQDSIIVKHIPSGRKVIVNKPFDNDDPDKSNIDFDLYVLENVDKSDVKTGNFRSRYNADLVKAHRNFNQSVVLDVQDHGEWLIGKNVKREEDYDFNRAFQDPDDPEAVVVWNKKAKVYCLVKKDFKGLPKLDPRTNLPIFTERLVSAYDPNLIQIDPKNVHFANLSADGNIVRVRRNFIGAKILKVLNDKEYIGKKNKKINDLIEEPELELKIEEVNSYEPEIILPTPVSKKPKKPKKNKQIKQKNLVSIEAIYLQRLEPSLASSRHTAYSSSSGLPSSLDESYINNLNISPGTKDIETPRRKKSNK